MVNRSERIFYFDALRALAILIVILLHVNGHIAELVHYTIHNIYTLQGVHQTFVTNFLRIGVDLFLMLSGALLLGRSESVKEFYIKRIPRLVKPFLFWSLVFTVMLFAVSYFLPGVGIVGQFGPMGFLQLFKDMLLCRALGSVVYWFVWMMLAVYILMPFLNKWIINVDLSKIEYFLIVWVVYNILVYTLMLPIPPAISFVVSPVGFAVLGYYLRYTPRRLFTNPVIVWSLIIIPSIMMLIYAYTLVHVDLLFIFERYSLPVTLVAMGVFCLFKNTESINHVAAPVRKAISSVALCSYGMYLIHGQMMMVARKIFHLSSNYIFDFLVLFAVGFIFSWLIIYVLSKIPIVNDLIGVK